MKGPSGETGTELLQARLIHISVGLPKVNKNSVKYSEKLDTVCCAASIQGKFIKT